MRRGSAVFVKIGRTAPVRSEFCPKDFGGLKSTVDLYAYCFHFFICLFYWESWYIIRQYIGYFCLMYSLLLSIIINSQEEPLAGIVILFGAIVLFCILFFIIQSRALSDAQMDALAQKRRAKAILKYYAFAFGERSVNPQFKKNMIANGSFYSIDESLIEFPSLAAGLLKYKKHEWLIIAFEQDQKINKIWINKGPDRTRVYHGINLSHINQIAKAGNYSTVMTFHNHPNSDPSLYSTNMPSAQDLESAKEISQSLLENDINLLEFVCERGRSFEFCRCIADSFFPEKDFRNVIKGENGITGMRNFRLRWELMFK